MPTRPICRSVNAGSRACLPTGRPAGDFLFCRKRGSEKPRPRAPALGEMLLIFTTGEHERLRLSTLRPYRASSKKPDNISSMSLHMAPTSYIHLRQGFGGWFLAAFGRPHPLPSTIYPLLHPGRQNNREPLHPICILWLQKAQPNSAANHDGCASEAHSVNARRVFFEQRWEAERKRPSKDHRKRQ